VQHATNPAPATRKSEVRVHFCTAFTCTRAATKAQIRAVERRASASPLVAHVEFVSKREALRIMRKKHPNMVAKLPTNPFPDMLSVIPTRAEDVGQVARLFRAGQATGIHTKHVTSSHAQSRAP
jgi:cell division protein FtsX